mgnify:CR=1 FL=1
MSTTTQPRAARSSAPADVVAAAAPLVALVAVTIC